MMAKKSGLSLISHPRGSVGFLLVMMLFNACSVSPSLLVSFCRMNSDTVDYQDACLIVRYLASMRPFAQSFDIYLTQVGWSSFQ